METVSTPLEHWDFPRGMASSLLLVQYAAAHGVPAEELLAGTGIEADRLRDPHAQIEARQELALVANLVRLLGDRPGLGVDVGATYRIATFGIFGFACITSPTLRDAIRFALRFFELSYGFCLPSVTITDDEVELRLASPGVAPAVDRFLLERDLTSMQVWLTDLLGQEVPMEVEGLDRGRFRTSLLDQPLPQANEVTVAAAEEACHALLSERRRRSGTAREVRDALVAGLLEDPASGTITDVATRLGLSERTLRRRLAAEGTSFRGLLAEVRQTLAEQLLATGALSVEDVALRLGYAEASSFIAAFRSWTNTTPARWLREHQA